MTEYVYIQYTERKRKSIEKKRKRKYMNTVETDYQTVEIRATRKIENQLDVLKRMRDGQRQQMTELYQLRMSREMKEDIFALLKSQNLELSFVLRSYIQTLLDENPISRQEDENSPCLATKKTQSLGNNF